MNNKFKDLSLLSLFIIILTFAVWLPHFLALPNLWGLNFSNGFNTIYRNFDGLEYVIIAKTFYRREIMATLPQSLPATYFASHFPLYSVLINVFELILGYLRSMLFVTMMSTLFACWAFYILVRDFKLTSQPLFLSFLFLILPARWLIVHNVGSSEPLFILFIILALYFVMKFEQSKKYYFILLSAISGLFAQLTRPPGILLFISLALYVHYKAYLENKTLGLRKAYLNHLRFAPLLLIPAGLLGIFYLYQVNLGDFWAYFHSGDNIHLTFPPFQILNKHQFWVGDIWLEDVVYIFILGLLGGVMLWKKNLYSLAFFTLTYILAASLVVHRDVSRYLIPISPFVLIAFEKVLTSKEFKIILPIIILIIYLYTQNFLIENVAPFPNPQLFN